MSEDKPSDEELYARWCQLGDPAERSAAWEELYARHHDSLLAYSHRIMRDIHAAEDCVEQAFLVIMDETPIIDQSFRAYLWTVARHLSLAQIRLRDRPLLFERPTQSSGDAAEKCILTERDRALEACLATLEPSKREFLELHLCYGFTLQDARHVVGWTCSLSTCNYRLGKVLANLRRCLKNRGFSFEKTAS